MARTNGSKIEQATKDLPVVTDLEDGETTETLPDTLAANQDAATPDADSQDINGILNSLKSLLSSVEKLQKVRQEVGDIKPLLLRMLDGEVVTGEELEQLKTGVGGLFRLVRAHSDHQAALTKAQSARELLDQVLKGASATS